MFCCTGFLSTLHIGEVIYFLSLEEMVSAMPSASASGMGFKQMQSQPSLPALRAARHGMGWGQTRWCLGHGGKRGVDGRRLCFDMEVAKKGFGG